MTVGDGGLIAVFINRKAKRRHNGASIMNSLHQKSTEAPALRLFLALWPEAAEQAQIAQAQHAWTWPPQARRYAPIDWHVTLHFIGHVPAQRLPELRAGLQVAMSPCELVLDRAACWPHGLAVYEATAMPPALVELRNRLGEALRALHLPVDSRIWRPHLTLARNAQGVVPPHTPAHLHMRVSGYVLAVSTGHPQRRYEILAQYGV